MKLSVTELDAIHHLQTTFCYKIFVLNNRDIPNIKLESKLALRHKF